MIEQLLSEILNMFSTYLVQLVNLLPFFLCIWLLFWFIRSLLFKN